MIRVVALAALLVLWLAPEIADASCDAQARAVTSPDPALDPPTDEAAATHLTAGNRFLRVQKYEEAAAEYVAGSLVSGAPVFLYNLGQSYRLAEEYEKAIRQYRLFLDRGSPGAALRALVECHVAMMQAELDKAAATEPPTGPAPETTAPRRDVPPDAPPWYADGIGWGVTGGGVVVAAIGGFFLYDAGRLDDEALLEDRQEVREALRDKADQRRLWGGIATTVGVAAIITGIVKLAITPDPPASGEGEGVSLFVGPGGTVGLAGKF